MKKNLVILIIGLLIFPLGSLSCGTTEAATKSAPPTAVTTTVGDVKNVLTADELVAIAPKLKHGEVLTVTGVIDENGMFEEYLRGPDGWSITLEYSVKTHNGLAGIRPGTRVVVRGKFFLYHKESKYLVLNGCSLISRDP